MPLGDWRATYEPAPTSRQDEDDAWSMIQALQEDRCNTHPSLKRTTFVWESVLAQYLNQARTASTSEETTRASDLIANFGKQIKDHVTATQEYSQVLTQLQKSLEARSGALSSLLKDNFSPTCYKSSEWQQPSVSLREQLIEGLSRRASFRDGQIRVLQQLIDQISTYEKQSLDREGWDECDIQTLVL